MIWLIFLSVILFVIIIILAVKIALMKKSAREIDSQLDEKLSTDTNTLITVSSSDKDICRLANNLNKQLKQLRVEHIRYNQGDKKLKIAVTNISHDLRTPLTAICGYLDFLKSEEKSEEAERYLMIIEERVEAMKQLTDELLKYSSAIDEKQHLQLEKITVNNVLEESILSFQAALQKRGITPEIDITEKRIIRKANKIALSRIFANLLNNALKYSDGDLKITMTKSGIITFQNHATALDKVQVEKMFDRFYTIETAKNSQGLGLSIAKTLAKQMNANILASFHSESLTISLELMK